MMHKLTKKQKALAQFLHSTYTDACKYADAVDPTRKRITRLDTIATLASDEFYLLTNELPPNVRFVDLATDKP